MLHHGPCCRTVEVMVVADNDKLEGNSWLDARSGRTALTFYQQGPNTHICVQQTHRAQGFFLARPKRRWLGSALVASRCQNQPLINPLRALQILMDLKPTIREVDLDCNQFRKFDH